MIFIVLNLAAIISSVYIAKIGLDYNKGSEKITEIKNFKIHPAELNLLVLDINYLNRAILVTLLELFRRKNIEIIPYKKPVENKASETQFKFVLKNENNLFSYEKAFTDALFENTRKITTEDLHRKISENEDFFSKMKAWHKSLENALREKGFYENKYKNKAGRIRFFGYLFFIIAVYSLINKAFIGILGILSSLFIIMIGINMGIGKSEKANSIHHYFTNFLELAKKNALERDLDEDEILSLIAMGITMKYFLPIYKNNQKYESINLFSDYRNEFGGSSLDDAVLISFYGFRKKTIKDSIDTNRVSFKLIK